MTVSSRLLRVAGGAVAGLVFFLEGACSSGTPAGAESKSAAQASPSSPSKEIPSSALAAYDAGRIRAWDPSRRFKALFKAEASPKVGAVGRGWLSVWWDGASGTLTWRASAPIAGGGRGGILRVKEGGGGAEAEDEGSPLAKRLSAADAVACILGAPPPSAKAPSAFEETPRGLRFRIDDTKRFVLLDEHGTPIELSFPNGEVVKLQPGEGVPRRIEANGRDGRAVLTLESYGPWPAGEEVPPR